MPGQTLTLLPLVAPLVTAILCFVLPGTRAREGASLLGAGVTLVAGYLAAAQVVRDGPQEALRGLVYQDGLSALLMVVIVTVGAAAACASVPWLRREVAAGRVPGGEGGTRWYWAGLHAFLWTMLATVSADSLGLLWVGLEATTLASALLVGFSRSRSALEAAWKYLILCTVGISCALFGVLLTWYAEKAGPATGSLDLSRIGAEATSFDPSVMRLAFAFIMVGFGTKAALAPLHTWIADAYSQAPGPVNAVMSGAFLGCALYGILRFAVLTDAATGNRFASHLLMAAGVVSVAVAVPFVLVQRDINRLLAYSSVEHVGLLALAFGIGGPLGITAGAFHLVNHAATKSALFFATGDLVQRYGAARISALRGALRVASFSAWVLLLGTFALGGSPPFSIFVSELSIVQAGFAGHWPEITAVAIVLVLLVGLFAGMLAQVIRIGYGTPAPHLLPADLAEDRGGRPAPLLLVATVPMLVLMTWFGVHVPEAFDRLLESARLALTVGGGG